MEQGQQEGMPAKFSTLSYEARNVNHESGPYYGKALKY